MDEEKGERENLDAHRVTVCSGARGGGKGTHQVSDAEAKKQSRARAIAAELAG